ncbi:MAG TPA: ABC transporter substrate-binding protein [Candidatus Binatia bacterium]|nr:ABC transporter substrate-binding protein [Candidatus Binatia bacterium]
MIKKILVWLLATVILTTVSFAAAQQPTKVYRIGYLGTGTRSPFVDVFEQGMRDHGYQLGKNLLIEYRFAEGKFDRLPDLAADLVRLNVDVIVTGVNPAIVAAKQATSTIPIVMTFGNDPIGSGLVASLANPGGNLTGLSVDTGDEFLGKRLELMKEMSGKLSRVAVLFNSANSGHQLYLKNLEHPARGLKLTLIPVGYRETGDFENAFKTMTTKQAGGVFLFSDGVSFAQRTLIASLAVKRRLPSGYPAREYVEAGGLASYGPDLNNNMRRAATYVDKILKGTKPADLPVEQPMKFELIISLKTAKQIGLTVPPNLLVRANKVIR